MSSPDFDRYVAACDYPGPLDEGQVNKSLALYLQALGTTRVVRRLTAGWNITTEAPLMRAMHAILGSLEKQAVHPDQDVLAQDAFGTRDALDARTAQEAREARIERNTRAAADALAAVDASNTREALTAITAADAHKAIEALETRAAEEARLARDARDAQEARNAHTARVASDARNARAHVRDAFEGLDERDSGALTALGAHVRDAIDASLTIDTLDVRAGVDTLITKNAIAARNARDAHNAFHAIEARNARGLTTHDAYNALATHHASGTFDLVPRDAIDAFETPDALDARVAFDARSARVASGARTSHIAINAITTRGDPPDAVAAINVLDAITAINALDAITAAPARDSVGTRDAVDAFDAREAREAREARHAHIAVTAVDARTALTAFDAFTAINSRAVIAALDARSAIDAHVTIEHLVSRDSLEARDASDARGAITVRNVHDARDAVDARTARGGADARNSLDARDTSDARKHGLALQRFTSWCLHRGGRWWGWWELSWIVPTFLGAQQLGRKIPWARPLFEAFLAGAWFLYWTDDTLYWIAKPTVHVETVSGAQRRRLHCDNGPAVESDAENLYFLHGVLVPAFVVLHPEWITALHVIDERNAEVRRIMLERMGHERFLRQSDAKPIHQDSSGVLYNIQMDDDETLALIEVENSTAEPDGTFKHYILRVPPHLTTAKAAVAWTFALESSTYQPAVEA